MDLFPFIPGYETYVYEAGRQPALVMLLAFLITFALTRTYTRLARRRGWGSGSVGGVHLHHVVVGIVLAFAAGALEFGLSPGEDWQLVLAAAFGSGVALVLDEFALVFRLQDVYWSTEGRSSVDAVVISTVLGGVLLLHLTPTSDAHASSRWALTAAVTLNLVLVLIAALKGRFLLATIGVFVWVFAWIGAIRLGKPTSVWARWRYKPDSRKHRRAAERDARYRARWVPRKDRLLDLIGGAPSDPEHR